jgi:hypothetical protein
VKTLLQSFTVLMLTTSLLYPLVASGLDRPLWWPLEGGGIVGGAIGYFLLVKFRRQL